MCHVNTCHVHTCVMSMHVSCQCIYYISSLHSNTFFISIHLSHLFFTFRYSKYIAPLYSSTSVLSTNLPCQNCSLLSNTSVLSVLHIQTHVSYQYTCHICPQYSNIVASFISIHLPYLSSTFEHLFHIKTCVMPLLHSNTSVIFE